MKKQTEILKEENRDLWYKKMGDRIPVKPEDESLVGLMEWCDLLNLIN